MNDLFPILAIETSGEICSAALLIKPDVYVEHNIMQKHVHSEKLIPVIEYLYEQMKINVKDTRTIAVSMGPGSFTGLRIGLATAKGIAMGCSAKISAVPTFDAAALSVSSVIDEGERFVLLMNTNIEEAYYSEFVTKNGVAENVSGTKLIKKSEIGNYLDGKIKVFGDVKPVDGIRKIQFTALNIAKWSYFFGKDLLISDFDLLEPNYFKNFIARVKK